MSFENPDFKFFYKINLKSLKSPNFRFFRFLKENLKKIRILDSQSQQEIVAISCVYSNANSMHLAINDVAGEWVYRV